MRRVLIVSGKAGGWQAMCPMMDCFVQSGDWEVTAFLCDQHLDPRAAPLTVPDGVVALRLRNISRPHNRLADSLNDFGLLAHIPLPDLIIVYGDRLDALLGATIGNEMRVPVVHLQAGDVSGGIDHSIRYAVSCLSTYLFCATEEQEERLIGLFDDWPSWKPVYRVGDHHLDLLESFPKKTTEGGSWVVHLHPDTLEDYDYNRDMAKDVAQAVGSDAIYLPPCTDRHNEAILQGYAEAGVRPQRSYLPLNDYVQLLLDSRGLIGNTSACVIDAPFLGVPSLCVGCRQIGRGVICEIPSGLSAERLRRLPGCVPPSSKYGNGTAGRQTFEILNREVLP